MSVFGKSVGIVEVLGPIVAFLIHTLVYAPPCIVHISVGYRDHRVDILYQ